MPGLDPRLPLVLDVRELGRRAGSMRRVQRTVPAPPDLGVALARVVPGTPVTLDLLLESVVEGVLVSGTAELTVAGECARCLDPITWAETVDLQELFGYPPTDARGAVVETPPVDEETDPLPPVVDDAIDLEPTLRDAVVLALPLAPLCRSDCPGLCPTCGARLADHPDHTHEEADPRWAALTALLSAPSEGAADPRKED